MDVVAGAAVGWSETIIGFPFLTVKCLQQNNQKWFPLPFKRYYRGVKYPFCSSVMFNMMVFPLKDRTYPYTNSYVLSGILTGAMSAYFSTYHALRDDYGSLIAGGAAGLTNWTLSFPFDTIKSRQLSRQISFKKAFSEGYLWTGFSIAALRSVIVNAVSFTVYEKTLLYLK
jgi:hypothetical protein